MAGVTNDTSRTDEQRVLDTDDRWIAAFNARDVDTLSSLYAPDVIVMPPGADEIHGRAAVRTWIEAFLADNDAHQVLVNDEVVVAGDWAFIRGHFRLTRTPRTGGATVVERGKHLVVWRREPDGVWRALRDIWNLSEPS